MDARAGRFALFDSIRALAALMVLGQHASQVPGVIEPGSALQPFLERLEVAVPVFFVVSGFLLYRPFVHAHLNGDPRLDTGAYAWRRFLRIVPGYWVALPIVVLWLGISGVFTPSGIPTYLGFAQAYDPDTFSGGLTQAWTLGIEVAFYAFLPFYAFVLQGLVRSRPHRRLRAEVAGVAVLGVASLAFNAVALKQFDAIVPSTAPWLSSFPALLGHLAIGMALAVASVAYESRPRPAPVRAVERHPGLVWGAAFVTFAYLAVGLGLNAGGVTDREWFVRNVLFGVFALLVVLPAVFGEERRGLVRGLLRNRALLHVGVVSYGFYLYHGAVLWQLYDWGLVPDGSGNYLVLVAMATVVSVGIATLSWRLVEQPALRLKRLMPRRRRDEAPEPPLTPEPAVATAQP